MPGNFSYKVGNSIIGKIRKKLSILKQCGTKSKRMQAISIYPAYDVMVGKIFQVNGILFS